MEQTLLRESYRLLYHIYVYCLRLWWKFELLIGARNLRTYLIGPIQSAKESSVHWRQKLNEKLKKIGIDAYMPPECSQDLSYVDEQMKRFWGYIRSGHRDLFNKDITAIRKRDFRFVEKSDFLITNFPHNDVKSVGSDQEIQHGIDFGICCYLINPNALSGESFWLLNTIWSEYGEVFKSEDELINYLKKKYRKYIRKSEKSNAPS